MDIQAAGAATVKSSKRDKRKSAEAKPAPQVKPDEPDRLECWVTLSGETGCIECGGDRTGSKPVALLPPRVCVFCKKEITDKWPTAELPAKPDGLPAKPAEPTELPAKPAAKPVEVIVEPHPAEVRQAPCNCGVDTGERDEHKESCASLHETRLQKALRLYKPLTVKSLSDAAPYRKVETTVKLREPQSDAIAEFMESKLQRPIITLPTGCGKTIAGLAIAGQLSCRTLWIAHREELITQPAREIKNNFPGLDYGIEMGNTMSRGERVIIATIQSIAITSRLERLLMAGAFGLVVFDECHHAVSPSALKVLTQLGCFQADKKGPKLLGLTATIYRADKISLDEVFDDVIYSMSIQEAIQKGYLVPPRAIKVLLPLNPAAIKLMADGECVLGDLEKEWIRVNGAQATAAAIAANCAGRKTLVFCTSVDQAKRTADACCLMGIKARWVSGAPHMHREDRKMNLAKFARGETQVLLAADLLVEGYDERSITAIVIAKPTKSQGRYCQMSGRGLRTHAHKVDCLIIDVVDASDMGFATTDVLLKGEQKPKKTRKRAEGAPSDSINEWAKLMTYLRGARVDIVEHGELTFARASSDMLVTAAKDMDLVILRRVGTKTDPGADKWQVEHAGKIYTFAPMPLQEAMKFCDILVPDFGGGVKPGSEEWNKAASKVPPPPSIPTFLPTAKTTNTTLPIALAMIKDQELPEGLSPEELAEKIDRDIIGTHALRLARGLRLAIDDGVAYFYNYDKKAPPDPERWGWESFAPGMVNNATPRDRQCVGWLQGDVAMIDPDDAINIAKKALENAGVADADIKIKYVRRYLGVSKRLFKSVTKEWIKISTSDLQ